MDGIQFYVFLTRLYINLCESSSINLVLWLQCDDWFGAAPCLFPATQTSESRALLNGQIWPSMSMRFLWSRFCQISMYLCITNQHNFKLSLNLNPSSRLFGKIWAICAIWAGILTRFMQMCRFCDLEVVIILSFPKQTTRLGAFAYSLSPSLCNFFFRKFNDASIPSAPPSTGTRHIWRIISSPQHITAQTWNLRRD